MDYSRPNDVEYLKVNPHGNEASPLFYTVTKQGEVICKERLY